MNALDMLRKDHERVRELFSEYDTLSGDGPRKNEVARAALHELELHSRIEEGLFYPAMRVRTGKDCISLVKNSLNEHHEMDDLIRELRNTDPSDPEFDEKFQELMENAQEHFGEEEAEMFPRAQMLGNELDKLGLRIQEEKQNAQI